MKIRVNKGGLSDYEVREQLDLVRKGLNKGRERERYMKAADTVPNSASRRLMKDAEESFNKMLKGIKSDVMEIISEQLKNN